MWQISQLVTNENCVPNHALLKCLPKHNWVSRVLTFDRKKSSAIVVADFKKTLTPFCFSFLASASWDVREIRLRRNIFFNFTLLICTQFLVLFTISLGHWHSFRCSVVWSYNRNFNLPRIFQPITRQLFVEISCHWLKDKTQNVGISVACLCDGARETK